MLPKTLKFCLAITLSLVVAEPDEELSSPNITTAIYKDPAIDGPAHLAIIPNGQQLTIKCNLIRKWVAIHGAWYNPRNVETPQCMHMDVDAPATLCPPTWPTKAGQCKVTANDPSTDPDCQNRPLEIVYSCYDSSKTKTADLVQVSFSDPKVEAARPPPQVPAF
ncbi:uncharacterized protein LOC129583413 [Paramacrobiotus metropolitanus]|uniref:uncharacterized protein LOC129583413 n=1 Tax=Paramacrobiotus metropolitanus TaxID=2943436 RepID=UPI0024459EA0|nr:uncharacterized protein LOC129583413 [Paramacrobiotus metropolitanus]